MLRCPMPQPSPAGWSDRKEGGMLGQRLQTLSDTMWHSTIAAGVDLGGRLALGIAVRRTVVAATVCSRNLRRSCGQQRWIAAVCRWGRGGCRSKGA